MLSNTSDKLPCVDGIERLRVCLERSCHMAGLPSQHAIELRRT